ncbi:Crp/Fnr family transcriptional regulator [Caldalkalibacillus thermarum]|uniref:Crp/Fnr family transcriptional regulator n=1 Tax=Caldalkalibacillus thermarum TaxID=296745 RepID=UPI00166A56DC|nr:Crp/Fnr family transcriptional regulator [Caldalkalibacillus thermarum]
MMQGQPFLAQERQAWQNTGIFSGQNFLKLKEIMYDHTFEAGSYLFWEGEQADKLFYIKQGQVKLTKTNAEGKEFTLHMFQEGDLVGELAGFTTLKHSYNALVTKDSIIGVIQTRDLEVLLWQHGDLAVEFIKWMGLMNRITETKVRDLMFYGKPGALCSTLIRLANTYGKQTEQGWLISHKVTHAELGEFIGATRESVNRMLRDLAKKGVIAQEQGHIIIKDIDYLRDICHCEHCPVTVCRI